MMNEKKNVIRPTIFFFKSAYNKFLQKMSFPLPIQTYLYRRVTGKSLNDAIIDVLEELDDVSDMNAPIVLIDKIRHISQDLNRIRSTIIKRGGANLIVE